MADEQIIAALDIGTTKVVALVGETDERGGVYVIGHGISPAEGLRRGVVVDMDKTVRSIQKAVDDAQMVSGTVIDRVTVGIAGEHVRSINSHGVVAVSRSDKEVTPADVQKAIEAARTVAIPVDREIIHVIPQEFSVDDQTGIKDPMRHVRRPTRGRGAYRDRVGDDGAEYLSRAGTLPARGRPYRARIARAVAACI